MGNDDGYYDDCDEGDGLGVLVFGELMLSIIIMIVSSIVLVLSGCIVDDVRRGACCADSDCEDGVICTQDLCVRGLCESLPVDSDCDSGFVCDLVLGCVPENGCDNNADCSDGIYCTVDRCVGGICENSPDDGKCPIGHSCSDTSGCVRDAECVRNSDCDEAGADCNIDWCVYGACRREPSDSLCEDGYICSSSGDCIAEPECYTWADCSDGLLCTIDRCTGGVCTYASNCSGALPYCHATLGCKECIVDSHCGSGEYCDNFVCVAEGECSVDGDCDDFIACTTNDCDTASRCLYTPVSANCDDGVYCTIDVCSLTARGCVNTATNSRCGSSLPYCHATRGCVECLTSSQCASTEYCSVNYVCVSSCSSCDDGVYCTVDDCNASGDCIHTATNSLCESGQYCDPLNGCRTSGSDLDYDGIPDSSDNCPTTPNPGQADMDADHIGDVCDCDVDGDGSVSFICGGWDCNDYNKAVRPGVWEDCDDGIDNDCDDRIDTLDSDCGCCS